MLLEIFRLVSTGRYVQQKTYSVSFVFGANVFIRFSSIPKIFGIAEKVFWDI